MLNEKEEKLVEAWKRFVDEYTEQKEEQRDGVSIDDIMEEESVDKEEEINKIIEEAKRHGKDDVEIVTAVLNAAVNSDVSLVNPNNFEILLDVIPEEKLDINVPDSIDGGPSTEDCGEIFRKCDIGVEKLNSKLLLNQSFMRGYLTGTPFGPEEINRTYPDISYSNSTVIEAVYKATGDDGRDGKDGRDEEER